VVRATAPSPLLPEALYARALAVGRRAAGSSGPNPPVGCVLVRDDVVIAEGATAPAGGPHAEVVALRAAGDAARGATAIVTLEPCDHHGRTPPCTAALQAAGIAEVHVLLRDPDPVAAGGLERLEQLGIRTVDVGVALPGLAQAAAHDLRGFLARVRLARPHVTLKLAQTADGVVTPSPGGYLTGPAARARVHRLRQESDAVLVGSGTVTTDDPRLDVRLVDTGADAAAEPVRQPRAVIVASRADLRLDARVVRPGTIVVVGPDAPAERRTALVRAGVEIVEVGFARDGQGLDVRAMLAELLGLRILTVLAEPGPRLARSLLAADAVDVIELHVAKGAITRTSVRPALSELADLVNVDPQAADRPEHIETVDGDLVLRRELQPSWHGNLGKVA